jgi:hypothetical protein
MELKLTKLADKALLVKLTMKRANLSRRDQAAEEYVQVQLDDASLVVSSKLFRSKDNPVRAALCELTNVYAYHKKHTLPYIDRGPRILTKDLYLEYCNEMRPKIAQVDAMVAKLLPDYDQHVADDIVFRSQSAKLNGAPSRASANDYPTAQEFASKMGLSIRFMPLPDEKHFLFDVSDEDIGEFRASMEQAISVARVDAVERMLKPLSHLADKLAKPIGTDGSIFRDSAVENILEGIDLARKLAIDDSPEIERLTSELEQQISFYSNRTEWLRESPIERNKAAKKLQEIASAMGAFMGVH